MKIQSGTITTNFTANTNTPISIGFNSNFSEPPLVILGGGSNATDWTISPVPVSVTTSSATFLAKKATSGALNLFWKAIGII